MSYISHPDMHIKGMHAHIFATHEITDINLSTRRTVHRFHTFH